MPRGLRGKGWVWVLWPLAAASCSSSEEVAQIGEPCFVNSDCASPLVCVFRTCHIQCRADEDCREAVDEDSLCQRGSQPENVCQNEAERFCATDATCMPGQLCAVDGRCRDHCESDRACTPGQVCAQTACANPDELVDGRLPSSSEVPASGLPCAYHSDCPEGNVCVSGVCREECRSDRDCGVDECCTEELRCAQKSLRDSECRLLPEGSGGAPESGEGGAPAVLSFAVESTEPEGNASGVALDQVVSVTFSEPLDPETVTSTTFTLLSGGVQVPAQVSVDGAVATLTPVGPLSHETRYVASLSTDVTSSSGRALKVPFSLGFQTRAKEWGAAELLEQEDGEADLPQVAYAPNGDVIVAFTQFYGDNPRLMTSRRTAKGWSEPVAVSNDAAGQVNRYVALSVAADGTGLLVWRQDVEDDSDIYASHLSGGVWGEPELIDAHTGNPAVISGTRAVLAMDANGNAVAAWKAYDGAFRIRASRFAAGSWSPATTISDPGTNGDADVQLAVAISAHGNARVTWQHLNAAARYDAWTNEFAVGAWGTATLLEDDDSGDAMGPTVAISPTGKTLFVWSRATPPSIMAREFSAGAFGDPEPIQTATPGGADPELVMDANGNAIAVWNQFDGPDSDVWANRYVAGSWGTPVLIEHDPAPAEEVKVAMRPDGTAVAVFRQDYSIKAARFDGSSWLPPEDVERGDGSAESPQVAVGPNGRVTVVWRQQVDSENFEAFATSFD